MIKAIAFDLDNTLIDFLEMKRVSCNAAAEAMIKAGLKADKKRIIREIYLVYDKKGYEYQRVFQDVILKLHKRVDPAILAAGIVAYKRVKETMLFPYPSVKPVLRKLKKKYKLAILTDAPGLQPWIRLVSMGLIEYFDVVIGIRDTKQRKPHKRPFRVLLKRLNMKPGEVMYVGDNMKRDVLGAKNSGMVAVFAAYGDAWKSKAHVKPDHTLKNFRDLLTIVD
jgi:putative hydrolase of the HAD superfamily